jgi:hypothetical protein
MLAQGLDSRREEPCKKVDPRCARGHVCPWTTRYAHAPAPQIVRRLKVPLSPERRHYQRRDLLAMSVPNSGVPAPRWGTHRPHARSICNTFVSRHSGWLRPPSAQWPRRKSQYRRLLERRRVVPAGGLPVRMLLAPPQGAQLLRSAGSGRGSANQLRQSPAHGHPTVRLARPSRRAQSRACRVEQRGPPWPTRVATRSGRRWLPTPSGWGGACKCSTSCPHPRHQGSPRSPRGTAMSTWACDIISTSMVSP